MGSRKRPGNRAIIEAAGGKCKRCGTTENLTVHHDVPLSDGGNNDAENLVIMCEFHQKELHGTDKKKSDFR